MDTVALRRAYSAFLDTAGTLAEPAGRSAPAPGEWNADQVLAHVAAVDASVLAVVSSVAAGAPVSFDNRLSLDPSNLARLGEVVGDRAGMCRRIEAQGAALCALVDQLGAGELDQPIPTVLVSGDTVLVDGPVSLQNLIAGFAAEHLPQHAEQLLASVRT